MGEDESHKIYDVGMVALQEYHEEICCRVMKGRNEGKGNFAYLEDDQIKMTRKLAKALQFFLWREHLKIIEETDKLGCCDKKCFDCGYPRYNFHSKRSPEHWCNEQPEKWFCQEECECK